MNTSALWRAVVVVAAVSLLATAFLRTREVVREGAPPARPALAVPKATDGAIALGNLDAEVHSFEARFALAPHDSSLRRSLVELLLARGALLGCVADYERAEALADAGVAERPDAAAYRTRASVRATFHRFEDALADLDVAESLGARHLERSRAAIFGARGALDEALALSPKDEAALEPTDLASLGLLRGELGDDAAAHRMLDEARARYRDVSPFPLAWMDYQEGALAERHGDPERARALYRRALALVPRYAPAAAHLAPMIAPDEAVAILTRVRERSDDPEIDVALAAALRAQGRADEAERHVREAAARYDELVARHREAYADHAARFWLGTDAEKAHALALANATNRPTAEALDLALTTALVTKRREEACGLAARALRAQGATPDTRRVAAAIRRAPTCTPYIASP